MWRVTLLLLSINFLAIFSADTPICQQGFTLINNKCLLFLQTPMNHTLAERKCAEYDGTLVTVKNANDNSAIAQIVGSAAPIVWIGLFCFDSDPSQCYWDDGSGTVGKFNNFATGFPITDIGQCVYYSNEGSLKGKWLSSQCNIEYKSFVCEIPPTFEDNGCQYNYNGYCYKFMAPLPYEYAENTCQEMNGHLASIHSVNENAYLSKIVSGKKVNYLIGARNLGPNSFSWSDDSTFDYKNIDPSKVLNTKCIAISFGKLSSSPGLWVDVDCNIPSNFICKRPVGSFVTYPPITVTPLPSNPSNCNSALVMAPGFISSPNYPHSYPGGVYCTYQLSTLGSFNILLRFLSFSTSDYEDYVNVYDGSSINSRNIGSYTGTLSPFSVISSGNSLTVSFQSRDSAQGFYARFTPYAYKKQN